MVTLWLMGTWVAMETCRKSKSISGDWLQLRRRVVGTVCSSGTLPRFCPTPLEFLPEMVREPEPSPGLLRNSTDTTRNTPRGHPQQNTLSISLVSALPNHIFQCWVCSSATPRNLQNSCATVAWLRPETPGWPSRLSQSVSSLTGPACQRPACHKLSIET